MDAAVAARMSDPLQNPHCRRRWREDVSAVAPARPAPAEQRKGDRLARLVDLIRAEWRRRGGQRHGGTA